MNDTTPTPSKVRTAAKELGQLLAGIFLDRESLTNYATLDPVRVLLIVFAIATLIRPAFLPGLVVLAACVTLTGIASLILRAFTAARKTE